MRSLGILAATLIVSACSQGPHPLDEASLDALGGMFPDRDPYVLDDREDPGHELVGDDADTTGPLVGDVAAPSPELEALLDEAESMAGPAGGGDPIAEGLLFSGSTLSLAPDTTRSPQRTTVQLVIEWRNAEVTVCSGTLMRPDAVVTAAHCVFDTRRGGFGAAITARAGAQGEVNPTAIAARRSFAPSAYRAVSHGNPASYPFDYGVVRLKRGFRVGVRSFVAATELLGRSFVVRGYPAVLHHALYDGAHMYESRDRVRAVLSSGVFRHRASTLGGMSGGGIDDGSRIFGVHSGGLEDDSSNTGILFSDAVLDSVRDWATRAL